MPAPEPDLPPGGERLGIVAGGGSLPVVVAQAARERGMVPIVARFADGISNEAITDLSRAFPWGRTGDAIDWLYAEGARKLVFCGTISSRPDFRSVIPSLRTLRILPKALSIVRGGDDVMLRNLSRYLETRGFELLAVQEIAPRLIAPAGVLSARPPRPREMLALAKAHRAATALGVLDAGQAAVASHERIIALEGIEGTRDMMRRVAEFRKAKRIGRTESPVLVKAVKPDQDRRFDLPSIGIQTIEEAIAAGISAIGVSAGESLILGIDDVLDAVNEAGICLMGLSRDEMDLRGDVQS
ncbi:DUF1009 domain-containing protein [Fulvimarina endophytica]|uniref:DUF1009 domain-containing protein n=1 Tax=Fulvimarina endophytica TaxID=2293836 RepID=A0A371WZL9_9HYPH|nr:UDP-2,3-diacylglucosamine diphosphatase LpxI [Fulvimarina endophytica]RFC62412.1 DUF1009 domain-containing protein [Fulvimarina endophytica]